MMFRSLLAASVLLVTVNCDRAEDSGLSQAVDTPDIRSTDFAVLPCSDRPLRGKCVIVMAGGKRVLIGAPAGATLDLSDEDLRSMDAVMLLSLRGEDVEGLDEIRNAVWRAGHRGSLPVAGPTGTAHFVGILNRAYETSDALTYVESKPEGGFDAALLAVLPGDGDGQAIVFDTGDLTITRTDSGADRAIYQVAYDAHVLVIVACGASEGVSGREAAGLRLDCESDWPKDAPVFLNRASGPF